MAEEPPSSEITTLDQSEIDRLLAQTNDQQAPKLHFLRADGQRMPPDANPKVEVCDFRNPVFFSDGELRRLQSLHEEFASYLSARLSLFLRMEFSLKLTKLTTTTYAKFTEALPNLSHICLFKAEPLIGVGILDLNPRLALTIADRLLGGRGHSVKAERGLTEIEVALLEDVILIILEEWCNQWKGEKELHGLIIGHESNGRYLQTSPRDAVMLILPLEVAFGDCSEQIQIGLPYYTIEPLVKSMQARRQKDATVSRVEKQANWQPAYDQIAVPVRAEWQAFELSLREIFSLRVGDVLEMQATHLQDTTVLLNGMPKFSGTVGLDTDRVAVKLARKLPQEDTNHAKLNGRKSP